jgi:hypothetical protein
LLERCWASCPTQRPEFGEVVEALAALVDEATATPAGAPNALIEQLSPRRSKPAQLLRRALRSSRELLLSTRAPTTFMSSLAGAPTAVPAAAPSAAHDDAAKANKPAK